jgi:hypothetical protein
MRYLAIALGLCVSVGMLASPLAAAQGNAAHHTIPVKARKNKSKFKPHKAPKHQARRANHANYTAPILQMNSGVR